MMIAISDRLAASPVFTAEPSSGSSTARNLEEPGAALRAAPAGGHSPIPSPEPPLCLWRFRLRCSWSCTCFVLAAPCTSSRVSSYSALLVAATRRYELEFVAEGTARRLFLHLALWDTEGVVATFTAGTATEEITLSRAVCLLLSAIAYQSASTLADQIRSLLCLLVSLGFSRLVSGVVAVLG